MAIQSSRSTTRSHSLEGAVLDALVVLLVVSLGAVIVSYVNPVTPQPGAIGSETTQARSLVDFRAAERGTMSAQQQSILEFRAGERP